MTKHSYQKGRSFTEPSLNKWVLREGSNDRSFPYANREAGSINREFHEPLKAETVGMTEVQSDSNQGSNILFDALETTRSLSSFVNTEDAVKPEEGDALIADNAVDSANGDFDNYGGLTTEDTF